MNIGWSFEELVSYAARSAWVRAGDLVAAAPAPCPIPRATPLTQLRSARGAPA